MNLGLGLRRKTWFGFVVWISIQWVHLSIYGPEGYMGHYTNSDNMVSLGDEAVQTVAEI